MKEEYPDVKEDLVPKAPEPRGKEIGQRRLAVVVAT